MFDIVEVDSSFYRTPSKTLVSQWRDKTPENFLFTVKMAGRITHELKLRSVESELHSFESMILGLGKKLASCYVQLPPTVKFERYREMFEQFLRLLNPKITYSVEFRDSSWMRNEVYDLLRKHNVCLV